MKIVLILANSADPNEMQHHAAFHWGFHCLPRYPFRVFQYAIHSLIMHVRPSLIFDPHWMHCVVSFILCLVLAQTRKTCPDMTEELLTRM